MKNELKNIESQLKSLREENSQLQKNYTAELEKTALLENIIAMTPGHVYWLDKNNVYLGCNKLQAESLGLESRFDIIGKRNRDLTWSAQAEEIDNVNREVLESGKAVTQEEFAVTKLGGRTMLSQKTPIFDRMGNITGVLGISFDITDRKQIEEALAIAKEQAEVANNAKTAFVMNLSHDLRTPITGMLGLIELLRYDESRANKLDIISKLKSSTEKLLHLLNFLLESVGSDQLVHEKSSQFSLSSTIEKMIEMYSGELQRKKLSTKLDFDPLLPHFVRGNEKAFERILLNLIGNAVKFTDSGEIIIGLKLIQSLRRSTIIELMVKDSGIGIPEEEHQNIFDKFHRLDTSFSSRYEGLGLGLAIVQELLTSFDGTIEVISEIGKGATFICHLTFAIADLEQDDTRKVNKTIAVEVPSLKTIPKRILIVEDNNVAQMVAHSILSEVFHCSIDICATAKAAEENLAQYPYDLIFLDLGLPDGHGSDIAKLIRSKPSINQSSIIIGLSAHVDEALRRSLKKSFNCVITKPLTFEFCKMLLDKQKE